MKTSKLMWPLAISAAILSIAASAVSAQGLETHAVGVVSEVWRSHGIVGLALLAILASTAFNLWMTKQMVNIAAKSAANHANSAAALSALTEELRRRPCIMEENQPSRSHRFAEGLSEGDKNREKRDEPTPYIS